MRPCRRLTGLILASLAAAAVVWWPGSPAHAGDQPKAEYLGDVTCLECHAQYAEAWTTVRHNQYLRDEDQPQAVRGCEGCHGPGSLHLEDENFLGIINADRMTGLAAAEPCLACHRGEIKASAWLAGPHSEGGLNCGTCHEVHATPRGPALLRLPTNDLCMSCHPAQRSELKLNSHHPVLEGRMDCTDCHNPHQAGLAVSELLKAGEDRCLRCHMDKRGPFAFEHQTDPGNGDDGCLTCHRAHGSPNEKLGRFYGRAMCLQCHADIAADPAHRPRPQSCWAVGCHNQIHGSNRDRLLMH